MYPFGSLPENLTGFCAILRREHAFRIGAGELLDAARALDVVNVSDEQAVRHALRAVLAATREDAAIFDHVFDRFFFPDRPGASQDHLTNLHRQRESRSGGAEASQHRGKTDDLAATDPDESSGEATGPMAPLEASEDVVEDAARLARSTYSPIEGESAGAPELFDVDLAWVEAARALVRRVQVGLSRRWRPVAKGRRFDLRHTLRASLQTGGEAFVPRWLGRPRQTPRFVLLIDGSRSMSESARTALRVAQAMAHASSRVEVFTFSTALRRVTSELRHAAVGGTRTLPALEGAWGGGTRIGGCFTEFLRRFGGRLIRRDTVVIVTSDGLDVGEPDALLQTMRELHRRSAALVWLNPLLETPGYEPTALGMSIARPFVTTFSSVTDLSGFVRLSRAVRVRA